MQLENFGKELWNVVAQTLSPYSRYSLSECLWTRKFHFGYSMIGLSSADLEKHLAKQLRLVTPSVFVKV